MDVRDVLKLDEGLKLKAYKDSVGLWTVGYGHQLYPQDHDWSGYTITYLEAEKLLDGDISKALNELLAFAPWASGLDQVRLAVLIDLCFNIGIGKLKHWPVFLGQMCSNEFKAAAANLRTTQPWVSQVGVRAERLAKMVEGGEWPSL